MIDLTVNSIQAKSNAKHCKERGVLLPTFEEMKHSEKIPGNIKDELKTIGMWDTHPKNLFRITWKTNMLKILT